MPCFNPDGTLTVVAKKIITALETPGLETEIAEKVGLPLYRVRSNLRELIEFDLVREENGVYSLTGDDDGKDKDEPIPEAF
jgi:predicted transcriptional regulator